jgi:hypothetical protein
LCYGTEKRCGSGSDHFPIIPFNSAKFQYVVHFDACPARLRLCNTEFSYVELNLSTTSQVAIILS